MHQTEDSPETWVTHSPLPQQVHLMKNTSYMYSTSQKKLNGSNGTCNFGDGNVTLLQSSTSVTRELLDCNLKVT